MVTWMGRFHRALCVFVGGVAVAGCGESKPAPTPGGRQGLTAVAPAATASDVTPCGREDPHGRFDDPLAQRQCCAFESKEFSGPCAPGFAAGPSPMIDVNGTVCDIRSPKPDSARLCHCANSAAGALGSCIHERLDPIATCKTVGAGNSKPAMTLFVAGLNHSMLDASIPAQADAIDQLANAIVGSIRDLNSLVIAISASQPPQRLIPCDAGDKAGSDGFTQNGECLAHKLEQLTGKKFQSTGYYPINSDQGPAGPALITGPRWRQLPGAGGNPGTPLASNGGDNAFEVYLQDTTFPRAHVSIYILHTGDSAAKSIVDNVRPIILLAQQRMHPGDFAPIFVGDFNYGYNPNDSGQTSFLASNLEWYDLHAVCDGKPPIQFHIEDNLMHAFAGRHAGATDPALMFPTAAPMARLGLAYSWARDEAQPTSRRSGIWMPGIAHNIVGLQLGYPATEAPSVCNPTSQPAPDWGVKDNVCLPSCAKAGGTAQGGAECAPGTIFKAKAYDASSCCVDVCAGKPGDGSWGNKNGQCLQSCSALGGKCQGGAQCSAGYVSQGNAYDCDACCIKRPVDPNSQCGRLCNVARRGCIADSHHRGGPTAESCGEQWQDCMNRCVP